MNLKKCQEVKVSKSIKNTWLENSKFLRKMWNHYDTYLDRTDNNGEGFNNKLRFVEIAVSFY